MTDLNESRTLPRVCELKPRNAYVTEVLLGRTLPRVCELKLGGVLNYFGQKSSHPSQGV